MQALKLLLFPQRIQLAAEFVKSVRAGELGSGVLLSGPNGVGKSGVGLLAYLLCAARRLPVVYLCNTETWVEEAEIGKGHTHLLEAFWRQNADLVAASEPLRGVFAAALQDDAGALTPHVMRALRAAVERHGLGIGVILDEVQHITAAVSEGRATAATAGASTAGRYFRFNWHDWQNGNAVFARMSIASAHGERDYKLPSGEDHRVRVVEPLSDSQREALQSNPDSPAFVSDPAVRTRIVFYSGNILRALMNAGRAALPTTDRATINAELKRRLDRLYMTMQVDCRRWLADLTEMQRRTAAEQAMELLSGKLPWMAAKRLYDAGILYRTADSDLLRPVSAAASSAYLTATAEHVAMAAKPLSGIGDGRIRGFALEAQVLARLSTVSVMVGNKLLDGETLGEALLLRSSYTLPFRKLEEVVPRDTPVLYRPSSGTYPCDGILMPAAGDSKSAVIVLECSVVDPRETKRVDKVLKYWEPKGVVVTLKQRLPAQPLFVALFYDGDLEKKTLEADALALSRGGSPGAAAGAAVGTVVRVFDRASLAMLGLVL